MKLLNVGMLFFSLITLSCTNGIERDLELKIINKEFFAYCPYSECNSTDAYFNKDQNPYPNIVSFKLTNHSKYHYIFIPVCLEQALGCINFNQFPKPNSGLSLKNIVLNNSVDSTIYSTPMSSQNEYELMKEEITNHFLNSIQESRKGFGVLFSQFVNENSVIIPAKSTLTFKTHFNLPYNETYPLSAGEELQMDKNKEYKISLYFRANADDIKKHLSENMKTSIEENNFKIFNGELISSNQIPLIFIEN